MRTKFNLITLFRIWIIAILSTGCEKIYDEPSDSVSDGVEIIKGLNPLFSFVTINEHINNHLALKGYSYIEVQELNRQLNADIQFVDSTFVNDDKIQYNIELKGSSEVFPFSGVGKMQVFLFKNYLEIGSSITIRILDSEPLSYSIDEMDNVELRGELKIIRNVSNSLEADLADLTLLEDDDIHNFEGTLTYDWLEGKSTPGIINDLLYFKGSGSLSEESEIEYSWDITAPLVKNMEFACSQYFTKGVMLLEDDDDLYTVDFDPFDNGACNNIILISKAGKSYEMDL